MLFVDCTGVLLHLSYWTIMLSLTFDVWCAALSASVSQNKREWIRIRMPLTNWYCVWNTGTSPKMSTGTMSIKLTAMKVGTGMYNNNSQQQLPFVGPIVFHHKYGCLWQYTIDHRNNSHDSICRRNTYHFTCVKITFILLLGYYSFSHLDQHVTGVDSMYRYYNISG